MNHKAKYGSRWVLDLVHVCLKEWILMTKRIYSFYFTSMYWLATCWVLPIGMFSLPFSGFFVFFFFLRVYMIWMSLKCIRKFKLYVVGFFSLETKDFKFCWCWRVYVQIDMLNHFKKITMLQRSEMYQFLQVNAVHLRLVHRFLLFFFAIVGAWQMFAELRHRRWWRR